MSLTHELAVVKKKQNTEPIDAVIFRASKGNNVGLWSRSRRSGALLGGYEFIHGAVGDATILFLEKK